MTDLPSPFSMKTTTAQIAALLEPFIETPLSPSQLDQISTYIDLLLRWNARINLTAIRNEEEIVTRHFGESFFLARHLFPGDVARTLLSANADSIEQPGNSQHLEPCHPERSNWFAESEAIAESKDPYPSPTVSSPGTQPPATVRVLDIGSG